MKNEEKININETKRLLKNYNKGKILKMNENPLLSSKFLSFLKIVNISVLVYIIFSTIFYFIVHYYGKRVIQSKTIRIEYEQLLYQNLFVNFYFLLVALLGFNTVKKRSLYYFCSYYFTLIIYSIIFTISYFSNFYADYFINKKFLWFSLNILTVVVLIFFYIVYHFYSIVKENKNQITETSYSNIIHEINLRIDMFKINFNYYVIKFRLNKVMPSLLYKKEDYYFTSLNKKNEKTIDTKSSNLNSESTMFKTKDEFSSLD